MSPANPLGLPPEFDKLPGFEFSRQPAPPAGPIRADTIFGIQNLADLFDEMRRRRSLQGTATSGAPPTKS